MKQIILFFMLIIPIVGFSRTNDSSDYALPVYDYTIVKTVDYAIINGQRYEDVKITCTSTYKANSPGVKVIAEHRGKIIYRHDFDKEFLYYDGRSICVTNPRAPSKVLIFKQEDLWIGGISDDGDFQ